MRQAPQQRIAKDAIKAWKTAAILWMLIPWLVTIGGYIISYFVDFPYWIPTVALIVTIILTVVSIFIIPKLRWRRWRYELFDQEIYIQHGILIVSRTLVPMIRVQHVDTKQGPILKMFNLASLTISTAATTHEIPALLEEEAAELRDQISDLARVDQEDV
ncbi:hypothetical protein CEY16_12120 [Halalkalibacillus sediminis]|uniref:YdbS-like PH domain-containing protein n=1 Tax=Halalkalibacillus sediminis TaxID=2018042 RepID=A0A2I0QSY8_9BACI|nr:PH domain-containing protein [Halalkalibacillus sediminis]PKR77465.1 hypothetical protein CEY16_12120 [Halalkalibacillus sediminis]